MRVALVGVTGYSGMVLYQMLKQHPNVDDVDLYGHNLTKAQPLASAEPQFWDTNTMLRPYAATTIMAEDDVVFFATSAGVTSGLAQPYYEQQFPVIDLSGDFRIASRSQYERWYHKPAAPADELAQAYYGLADWDSAKGHTYVANPGCYATATLLGLAPLAQAHLVLPQSLIVDAKSGTSGAGKRPGMLTHFSQANENLQLYKVNEHQHIPEIVQQLKQWDDAITAVQFSTTLLPITRGLMSTIYARVQPGVTADQVEQAFVDAYSHKPGVRYRSTTFPDLKEVVGTGFCDVGAVYNPVTGIVTVVSVIDNLIKGAGGQALQNLNQMFGFPLMAGIPVDAVLP